MKDTFAKAHVADGQDFPAGAAIVIGGSGGIGSAICRVLARQGADVAISYRSSRGKALAAADEVRSLGRRAEAEQLDALQPDACKSFVEKVATQFGSIHTVVFASGPHIYMEFISKVKPTVMEDYIAADAMGFFNVVQAAIPYLREARGSVVAVHTAGLKRWPPRDVLSVVPKAAVEALIQGLAREEGRFGIRSNSVGVGFIKDGMYNKAVEIGDFDENYHRAAIASSALKRIGTAGDIAEAVAFLASSRANYITGQSLAVDGGFSV